MDFSRIDLNLLVVFDAILKNRSVTVAGASLGLSQPTMSYSLAKLRVAFNDPLFVKTSHGMLPTPLAEELSIPIANVLHILDNDVFQRSRFDPATSDRTFKFCMSDIGELGLLPFIVRRFGEIAPRANIKTITAPPDEVQEMLRSGDADLAVGFFPDLKTGFYQQTIDEHTLVCMVSADHPTIRDELTLKQFVEGAHAVVHSTSRAHEVMEQWLADRGIQRRILLDIPHYSVIPLIIQKTDLIVTLPRVFCALFGTLVKVKLFPPPFEAPSFFVRQHWHERYQSDPANKWLRGQIADLFLGKTHWWESGY